MTVWLTSDTHFGHKNIVFLCKRPFRDVFEMNEALIRNWNRRVKPHDSVIHLGDFAFRSPISSANYLDRLNGNITLIQGNHDGNQKDDAIQDLTNNRYATIQSLVVNIGDQDIFCTHEPVDFSSAYAINLVGHVHEKWEIRKIYKTFLINVGVDVWNFSPVNIDEIIKRKEEFEKKWNRNWKRKYGRRRVVTTVRS